MPALTPQLRRATESDIGFLAGVVLSASQDRYAQHPGWDRDAFYAGLLDDAADQVAGGPQNSTTSVIVAGGVDVGRVRLVTAANHLEIAGLQVLPEHQNNGIGTSVVTQVVNIATAAGTPVILDVETDNPDARRLYQRLGFRPVGPVIKDRQPMILHTGPAPYSWNSTQRRSVVEQWALDQQAAAAGLPEVLEPLCAAHRTQRNAPARTPDRIVATQQSLDHQPRPSRRPVPSRGRRDVLGVAGGRDVTSTLDQRREDPCMTRLIPPGAEERYVDTESGRLRVLHGGEPHDNRRPAVLLHGGGTDNAAISWYRLIEPLGNDREVWAIDLPGFGGSIDAVPVGGPRELAATVADALHALGVGPSVVFGVSMGGDVALNLALDRPPLVAGLVLIGSGGLVPSFGNRIVHFGAWLAAQLPDWILLPAGRFANRFARAAIRAIVKDPRSLPAVVVEEFTREARDPRGSLGYTRYNQATIGRHRMLNDLTDVVEKITVPTLLVHGAEDQIVDPAGSRTAAERIPHAELVMVPDCGHWAQLEAHERFLTDTRAFLARFDQGNE